MPSAIDCGIPCTRAIASNVIWNYLFRTSINLSKNVIAYTHRGQNSDEKVTGKDLEDAAVAICKALKSTYVGLDGKKHNVRGDLTKVAYVKGLPPVAHRMLGNLRHVEKKVAGTQEMNKTSSFCA